MGAIIELPIVVIDGQAFKAVDFLDGQNHMSGYDLARHVRKMSNLGDRSDAELFLIRPELILNAWHSIVLVFAGTIEYGRFGFLGFSILIWCEHFRRLYREKRWLGWGLGEHCRLVMRVPALTFEAKHLVRPSP